MSETTTTTTELPVDAPAAIGGAPDAAAPEGQERSEGEAAPQQPEAPKREDWRDVRFRRMAAQKIEAEKASRTATERAALLEAELERFRAQARETQQNNEPERRAGRPDQQQPDVTAQVEARVAERAAAIEFNAGCDRVASAMQTAFPDAQDAVAGLHEAGLDFTAKDHRDLIAEINSLPNAAQVLYSLGKDRNEFAHLLGLSPRAQGIALARFVSGIDASAPAVVATQPAPRPVPVSAAPPPSSRSVPTGTASGAVDLMDDKVPMERWYAEWEKKNKKR